MQTNRLEVPADKFKALIKLLARLVLIKVLEVLNSTGLRLKMGL